jgi:hypothetical protein
MTGQVCSNLLPVPGITPARHLSQHGYGYVWCKIKLYSAREDVFVTTRFNQSSCAIN